MEANYWVLIGVLTIVVGIVLRLNILLVILISGVITGLLGHMSIIDITKTIGHAFTQNRAMSVFIVMLPAIGILERHGLRNQSEKLMMKLSHSGAWMVWTSYMLIRMITIMFGITVGGHPQTVRPLLDPMASGALGKGKELPAIIVEKVKALSALSENIGNFFGQNVFVASGGVLLVKGFLETSGYDVDLLELVKYAGYIAIISFIITGFYFFIMDISLRRQLKEISLNTQTSTQGEN